MGPLEQVTITRFPITIGEESPRPGRVAAQVREPASNRVGSFDADTPSPPDPRNCNQSSARAALAVVKTRARIGKASERFMS